ncbi:hypothetical protein Pmar_PMAR024881 [Perkinsus marinus ATCC 50983]|uniref:Uncharacterized protein n=1 Tax=Perkinsus marinus (strain ATCC 50983 / TXsc) TaxID=423536 RepID=C5LCW5_PERM5|nr:hypothetical protein Pmar_PMAR024881 [Perkinsus marinus ATCC 50983]EER05418.1 hypothetical protein Pmar_PMAR024881 [Perkinsus marinus ATCC 50983]|eukprot:XP_002773602.1 hypothetical protein Pmar_PMAR024881 [Perkinsus marinus ATCC 50983]
MFQGKPRRADYTKECIYELTSVSASFGQFDENMKSFGVLMNLRCIANTCPLLYV